MDNIDKLLHKLQILGSTIIAKNRFVIIYRDPSGTIHCAKKNGKGKIDADFLKDCIHDISLSDNFLVVALGPSWQPIGLYVEGKDTNILSRAKTAEITYPFKLGARISNHIKGDTRLVMYRTSSNRASLLNSKGIKYDITDIPYLKDRKVLTLHKQHGRYILGYSEMTIDNKEYTRMTGSFPIRLEDTILSTDEDFRCMNIRGEK